MIFRLKIAIAALVMLVLFLTIIIPAAIAVPFLLVVYIFAGSDWLRSRVTSFGQGLDGAANVVFLDGHPKETISSHVGRWYEKKYGNAYEGRPPSIPDLVIPWRARFVKWLTDKGEPDHVYKSVEQWAVDKGVPL